MESNFHKSLKQYIDTHDKAEANRVVMEELGKILIKDRENFITLLKYSEITVPEGASDARLIDLFIDNIDKNQKLVIGAAFLANQHNKQMGFDGQEEVSDEGVKAVHQTLFSHFDSGQHEEEHSNALGLLTAGLGAIGGISNLGSKAIEARQKNKHGIMDMATKKEEAKQQLVKTVLEQRRLQQEALAKKAAAKAKQKKTIIIISASVLGLILIIGGAYLITRKK